MINIQEELAKGTPSHAIMEQLSDHTARLGSPFFLSDLMIFEPLIEEFYRQERPARDMETFFMMEHVVHLVERCEIPPLVKEHIAANFVRLTGVMPNRFALEDHRARERYRHALTVLYSL